MPATEQTWRNQSRLHKWFAVTSVLMLAATIWMLALDHAREWKPIQRTANRVEMRMTSWRELQFLTEEALDGHETLIQAWDATRRQAVPQERLDAFFAQRRAFAEQQGAGDEVEVEGEVSRLNRLAERLREVAGREEAERARDRLLDALRDIIRQVRFREDTLLGQRKFKAADRDAAVAALGLMERDGRSEQLQAAQQREIDVLIADFDALTLEYQAFSDHRKRLEEVVAAITAEEDAAAEAVSENQAELRQMEEANASRRSTYFNWFGILPVPGKRWLELPILDAFNSPRKIDNLWSDGLLIDYNFEDVSRFDRCTTCHQLIDKAMPGTPDVPAYVQQQRFHLILSPPRAQAPSGEDAAVEAADAPGEGSAQGEPQESEAPGAFDPQKRLAALYGLRLAPEGLLSRDDVTVQFVWPESPAARAAVLVDQDAHWPRGADQLRTSLLQPASTEFLAPTEHPPGLTAGDVIVEIGQDGNPVYDADRVSHRLLDAAESGEQVVLTVLRGMPNPYASHPRLDLFVGSLSPHNKADFACTICHEGQGSATAFKWASHSPNSVPQRQEWRREHGWFDNPHWIYPMYPDRFAESACLKCHHEVSELEPSERFPDPPAPKVVRGHDLIAKYGCFGCHEINGYDGPERVGPDMRLEPNIFAAALQLQADPGFALLSAEAQDWAFQLVQHPERDGVRRRLYEVLAADAVVADPVLSEDTHTHITPLLKDTENPGRLRKRGPSLRFVGSKLDFPFLFDWIREPRHFRPSTRMPQFFGQWSHLAPGSEDLAVAQEFEHVEVLGMAAYLLAASQDFVPLAPPAGVAAASAERGRVLFENRCLACHSHQDFPDAELYRDRNEVVQGPDLSGVGDKLAHQGGRLWLYSWIREPTRYHARTFMPAFPLDLVPDAEGNLTDPAGDIVEYLMSGARTGWVPAPGTPSALSDVDREALVGLTLEHLRDVFSTAAAQRYVQQGIDAEMRAELLGAEVELVVTPAGSLTDEDRLRYIGRKSIGKYGCYACHDIPGFEDAKPIGTGLADWGRKNTAQLAFEHILQHLEHGHAAGGHAAGSGGDDQHDTASVAEVDELPEYYLEQIEGAHRAGFIYQKLREPRSYDYHKTANKRYNERLRMPQFNFDHGEREAVVTFVLGLVASPPTAEYVYQADERRRAILEGQEVLKKYNCAGCHLLDPQQWTLSFPPDAFPPQREDAATFPYLSPHFSPEAYADSLEVDRSGQRQAVVSGMPTLDTNAQPVVFDDEGFPIEEGVDYDPTRLQYPFDLWQPALLDGNAYRVGVLPLAPLDEAGEPYYGVLPRQIRELRETRGGFLARYLVSRVTAREKQTNPAANGAESWGWVPPPLVGEGQKVQTDWLHTFLLDPFPIRPATVLRMPRFNMSPAEATRLVNYFAAVDDASYPYRETPRRQEAYLAALEARYQAELAEAGEAGSQRTRFDDAMKIVTNRNFCVQCHLFDDFRPEGADRALAPDLALVYQRLRPDYVRDWIANPKSILPYTGMPVNIPYNASEPHLGGVSQDLFRGTSVQQLDAVVDLLMNYDADAQRRSPITPLVPAIDPATAAGQATAAEAGEE